MIERLLAAEGALERDELDHAQRLFGQVAEADPRNAIAVVGLARVLLKRGDVDAAHELVDHALEIDPDEAAAQRLLRDLEAAAVAAVSGEVAGVAAGAEPPQGQPGVPVEPPRPAEARRSLLDRLLGWLGLRPRS